MEKEKRGPGRPKKHETDYDRIKAFRKKKTVNHAGLIVT